jgi:hypothetical protein
MGMPFMLKSFKDCQNGAFGSQFEADEFLVFLYDGEDQDQSTNSFAAPSD